MEKLVFSLIVATYGRVKEIGRFLNSMREQDFDLNNVEILIVDQNDQNNQIDLSGILDLYKKDLRIVHLRTAIKGTSHSRNLGLKRARGEIIAFPDDDCTYYPDTLKKVISVFEMNPKVDCLSGRIYDRLRKESILRNWGNKSHFIKWRNFYFHSSAITKFIRRDVLQERFFCEELGPGTKFGACEDPDYIASLLKDNCKILYVPDIEVWHPKETIEELSEEKIKRYGLGFGGFCRKNFNLYIFFLFISAIAFHGLHYIIDGAHCRRKRRMYIQSRIQGWINWENRG